jgi:hypothetical protein
LRGQKIRRAIYEAKPNNQGGPFELATGGVNVASTYAQNGTPPTGKLHFLDTITKPHETMLFCCRWSKNKPRCAAPIWFDRVCDENIFEVAPYIVINQLDRNMIDSAVGLVV